MCAPLCSAPTVIRRKSSGRRKRALTKAATSKHESWLAPLSTRVRAWARHALGAEGRKGLTCAAMGLVNAGIAAAHTKAES
jgi:hypothetical protein